MQNKTDRGWSDGFVPVRGSWDFNLDRCSRCNGSQTAETARPECADANRGVGMVGAVMQTLGEVYESPAALRAGTLFPELHMPLRGYSPAAQACGDAAQANAFAAWELRLFLNTHPHDCDAMKLFRRLMQEAGDDSYATAFLPEQPCANAWDWVNAPWPWEYDAQCGR